LRVTPGSPADVAKLRADDIILEYGGVRVDDDSHLINMVSLTEVGKEVPVVVLRDHKLITVLVKVGTAATGQAAANIK
jgi:serine protease Do